MSRYQFLLDYCFDITKCVYTSVLVLVETDFGTELHGAIMIYPRNVHWTERWMSQD